MAHISIHPVDQGDRIRINDLVLPVLFASGAQWSGHATEQLVHITLSISHDISSTAETEDVKYSINYASLADDIRIAVAQKQFQCIQDLSRHICDSFGSFSSLKNHIDGLRVWFKIAQPKAFLHSKAIALEYSAHFSAPSSWTPTDITHIVDDLTFSTIIGIEPGERVLAQNVIANIEIKTGSRGLDSQDWIDVRYSMQELYKTFSTSNYLTLEALTSAIASSILTLEALSRLSPIVSIRAAKPSALSLARSAEIQLVRTLSDYSTKASIDLAKRDETKVSTTLTSQSTNLFRVAIALGSNLGDSFQNIEYALRLMEIPHVILGDSEDRSLSVVDTSFLYETAPMYVTDQPSFINCACVVETNIRPLSLLHLLKEIERIVGRVPSVRNGPRAVDLDIVFYGEAVYDTRNDKDNLDDLEGELVIPHPRVQEREFVLRPLADMIPDYVHPNLKQPVHALLAGVYDPKGAPMQKVIPFPRFPAPTPSLDSKYSVQVPETLTHWTYPSSHTRGQTRIMATLNVTPDSFSDGATHDALPAALAYACSSVSQGATIIDVGGYSTRPSAAFVSVEEEIARVVPAVAALRNVHSLTDPAANSSPDDLAARMLRTPVSVDTFRWEVAEAALKTGANCINDVYAFTGPESWPPAAQGTPQAGRAAEYMTKMKAVAREHAVPVVLMHSRGDAGKNKEYDAYRYAERATLEGVRVELGAKVDAIVRGPGGVRRWLVVIDPGIGFSKTLEGNLEVLSAAREVVADVMVGQANDPLGVRRNPLRGYMQLIGVSRKSFLGAILAQSPHGRETTPKERTWATAAAVTCAVQQGAGVVRVHDVKEMVDVVKVAGALWL